MEEKRSDDGNEAKTGIKAESGEKRARREEETRAWRGERREDKARGEERRARRGEQKKARREEKAGEEKRIGEESKKRGER